MPDPYRGATWSPPPPAMPVDLDATGATAVCRECSFLENGPYVQPLKTRAEAEEWAVGHHADNTHRVEIVDGWPNPQVAYDKAFGANAGVQR